MAFTDAKLGDVTNATDPSLRSFKEMGGKIIMWHGWDDPAVSGRASVDYYNRVVRAQIGLQDYEVQFPDYVRGRQETDPFLRLFMVPGMLHCEGGPGANAFGQNLPQATPLRMDPKHDVLSALERWSEEGVPPDKIIAVKWVDDDPALGVIRTRPLCPFPQIAHYAGHGSTDEAANFVCMDESFDPRP
jgi:feruloyl esterase